MLAVQRAPITWFLLADRSLARIFASDGGVKNLRLVERIEYPKGRLPDRKLVTDRDGASKAYGNTAAWPVHGLTNKNQASAHETRRFALQLARRLRQARSQGTFQRLVLVAEARFLGELKGALDPDTADHVTTAVPGIYREENLALLKRRLQDHLLP